MLSAEKFNDFVKLNDQKTNINREIGQRKKRGTDNGVEIIDNPILKYSDFFNYFLIFIFAVTPVFVISSPGQTTDNTFIAIFVP